MYKYWVKYEKTEPARFISHLDLLRALDRAIRRADIPIAYSQGFNPHPKLSFATPLSVGIISHGDYLELELTEELSPESIINRMNATLPQGIQFLESKMIEKRVPTLGALVEATSYKVEVFNFNKDMLDSKITNLLGQKQILVERKSKKGMKTVDILPLIRSLKFEQDGTLTMLLTTNSTGNAKPKEVLALLDIENPNIDKVETFCNSSTNRLVTPLQWLDLD